jgi:hypothetical protein
MHVMVSSHNSQKDCAVVTNLSIMESDNFDILIYGKF